MRSLCRIQNPEDDGLGEGYRPTPLWPDDVAVNLAVQDEATRQNAGTSQVVTQSPEELVSLQRRALFLSTLRPGPDYGFRSNERNAFFDRDSGLGLDIFGAIAESVKKSAPEAFKGIKGSEVLGIQGIKLPSWVPRVSIPKPIQSAASATAKVVAQAQRDLKAKKDAENAAKDNGVATQTLDFPSPPPSSMIPWVVAGGALVLILAASWRKR